MEFFRIHNTFILILCRSTFGLNDLLNSPSPFILVNLWLLVTVYNCRAKFNNFSFAYLVIFVYWRFLTRPYLLFIVKSNFYLCVTKKVSHLLYVYYCYNLCTKKLVFVTLTKFRKILYFESDPRLVWVLI